MSTPAPYTLKIYAGQPLSTPFQYAISGIVVDLTGWGLRPQPRPRLAAAGGGWGATAKKL